MSEAQIQTLNKFLIRLFSLALYYPHCAIANCLRYFTTEMALLKTICQNLNKKLSDIELAYEFQQHGLFIEYLKSENGVEDKECWTNSLPVSTISSKFQELKIQDSIFFQKWWNMIRNRKHSTRKTDVIQMLDVIQSNEILLKKLQKIFGDYDSFMKMYRKLETIIQKQLFLIVCQHTIIVVVAIHLLTEINLEWGDLLDEKLVKLVKVNYTIHLLHICHDFGCLALTSIICRNEVKNVFSFRVTKNCLKRKTKCSFLFVCLFFFR